MFELSIARRHIFRNPRMALFTILSVALAVAIIVVMMGLMGGFKEEILSSMVDNNPHITIEPKEGEKHIHLYQTLTGMIKGYPGVTAVSARLTGKAAAKYKDRVRAVNFVGVDPYDEVMLMNLAKAVKSGDFMDLKSGRHSAFMGTRLAEELKIKPENSFYLVLQDKTVRLRLAGLIEKGTGEDKSLLYLPLATAQDITGKGDVVSEVGVRLSYIYEAPIVAGWINNNTSYKAKSWQEMNADILNVIETQSWFAIVFYILIFAIAGFGIANTMIMIITRRTREIGILMAMGAGTGSILRIFIIESVIMAPPAAALGCALGYLSARLISMYRIQLPSEIYRVSTMTVTTDLEFFIFAALFAVAVNFIAGLYPAWKASRMDPVKAIRTV